jgi:hypothetical protein
MLYLRKRENRNAFKIRNNVLRWLPTMKKKTSAFAQAEVEVGLETSVVHRLNNAGR